MLAGDFNCDPAEAPALDRRLQGAGFGDAAAGASRATWDPQNPLNRGRASGAARRVDHIFVRAGGGRRVAVADMRVVLDEPAVPLPGGGGAALPLSDHYGLVAELTPA